MTELNRPLNSPDSFVQWLSPDNHSVTIRPIRSADLDREREFVNALSTATGYQRLLSQRNLSEDELRRFTDIDYTCHFALVATTLQSGLERQVGVARYIRDDNSGKAEFSIVLSDDWQARGLGNRLLCSLIDVAQASGIHELHGSTLTENTAMIKLARKLNFTIRRDPQGAYITLLTLQLGSSR